LKSAALHAQQDNIGRLRIKNATPLAKLSGNHSLKTVFFTAKSLANKDNGGEPKTNLANLHVMLHGFKDLPTMFQLALDLVKRINS